MKKSHTHFDEIKLVGITTRTNNHLEMAPETSKIEPLIRQYFENNVGDKITGRTNPGTLVLRLYRL